MARYAKKITISELQKFIEEMIAKSLEATDLMGFFSLLGEEAGNAMLQKDLSKFGLLYNMSNLIEYDDKINYPDSAYYNFPLLGYHTVNNLSFLGLLGGSDYGEPLFFILYQDNNNKLRGYIPKKGNAINPFSETLFGEEETEDDFFARQLGFKDFSELLAADILLLDKTELIKDINNRIQIK